VISTEQNIRFLRQGMELLESLAGEVFAEPGSGGQRASVGAHLRHCIDYYRCFLRGLEAGRIDYDERQRDPRIELEPAAAREAIEELVEGLSRIEAEDFPRELQVKVDAAAWHDPALVWSRTSLGRELQFLLSHTVHHYALIAMILRDHGIEPPSEFGVAPSTLEHRREVGETSEAVECVR